MPFSFIELKKCIAGPHNISASFPGGGGEEGGRRGEAGVLGALAGNYDAQAVHKRQSGRLSRKSTLDSLLW
jgi:hypothetical protein